MKTPDLQTVFDEAIVHRADHQCGGYPYEHGDMLTIIATVSNAKRILEFGTGLGYTAICLTKASNDVHIDTIDQDSTHLEIAKVNWDKFRASDQITAYYGKAEAIIPTFTSEYDLIFFDGYAPSMKFLTHFDRLLKVNGILITANLFVKDPKGGKYLRALKREKKWQTATFSDTAISVKKY